VAGSTCSSVRFTARLASLAAGREDELSRYGRMAVESSKNVALPLAQYLDAWTQLGILEREVDEWFERRRLALCPVAVATST
jgi:hypothetical protein